MTKKEFLKELEKKLSILNGEERKDIIDEYNDNIDEKIKNGASEEQAVEDFGSIDLLCKEILTAYKINPEYNKSDVKEKTKEFLKDGETLIKKGARGLSDFTSTIIAEIKKSDKDITVESLFEIIIKALIFLVVCAVLRLPFLLIETLGNGILGIFFPPLNFVLIFVWKMFVSIIYLIICILIAIPMFKNYFSKKNYKENVDVKKTVVKKESKKNEKASEKIKEDIKEEVIIQKGSAVSTVSSTLLAVAKALVVMVFLIPLFLINLGMYCSIAVLLFALIKGINVLGLIIIVIGVLILFSTISSIIYNFVFKKPKFYFAPFVVSMIFMIIGSFLFIETMMKFNYYDVAPKANISEIEYKEVIDKSTRFDIDNGSKEVIIDNTLKDNEITIKIMFHNEFVNYEKMNYETNNSQNEREMVISLEQYNSNGYERSKKMYNLVINNLKDDNIYDYSKLYEAKVIVYVNQNSRSLIK